MLAIDKKEERELFDSCRTLFGAEIDVGWDFLFTIQISGVKSAFRKRALLTHPDLCAAAASGTGPAEAEAFISTKEAYDRLLDFVRRRHAYRPRKSAATPRRPAGRKPTAGRASRANSRRRVACFYTGTPPRRRLLVGEFLFYSGMISWESLIEAILWQRRQRPRLGNLACEKGWVRPGQLRFAIMRRAWGVPLGEALVRFGLLDRWQVEVLLSRQRRLQSAMGEFFVSRGKISRSRMNDLLTALHRHNEAFPRRR